MGWVCSVIKIVEHVGDGSVLAMCRESSVTFKSIMRMFGGSWKICYLICLEGTLSHKCE